ncbi:Transmembrane protein [Nesidiocoris tenuis]|uniref:Macoilin n=1 Tax=Nesidiocoris tenuis TaxID=355587 RepID=A0ABN7AL55_9HEMI|nr:Transmembrane protein [Nesidiocoris tenuis]
MKRRNGEIPKLRRPVKRSKITDGIYGSTLVYLKFFMLWALVLLADFLLEFRFEFLWPFWLLLRSVYDSYKYQGLAFSVFFVSIALTSDMICYFFIPVQWLFFAASTYVWVQYVWHAEKGICFPTVVLWFLFAYMEAAVRLKDLRHMPFHLDLCRPFAAHCIGYPVVTLGFGFKSYVSYRIRQRRQREVRKENGFYMNLLSQALPIEAVQSTTASPSEKTKGESNGVGHHGPPSSKGSHRKSLDKGNELYTNGSVHQDIELNEKIKSLNGTGLRASKSSQSNSTSSVTSCSSNGGGPFRMLCFRSRQAPPASAETAALDEERLVVEPPPPLPPGTSGKASGGGKGKGKGGGGGSNVFRNKGRNKEANSSSSNTGQSSSNQSSSADSPSQPSLEYCQRLESDLKRLKSDQQSWKANESELKSQLSLTTTAEKAARAELATLRHHHDDLQSKVQSLMSCRSADQKAISSLEKRLAEERKLRSSAESALAQERKANKAAQLQVAHVQQLQKASLAVGGPTSSTPLPDLRNSGQNGECCNESCRQRRRDLEGDLKTMRRELKDKEGKCANADRELQNLMQYKESQTGAEMLLRTVTVLQDKTAHLENSLSAETRIKLDLFSALGEAKRHLEIRDSHIRNQEREIEELKAKLAQVLAVMPGASDFLTSGQHSSIGPSKLRQMVPLGNSSESHSPTSSAANSNLDPNASVYTPKPSRLVSEA